MRLHQLEATAFGPFAGTVRVDFDQLSEAGLFLLSGATGAGKTSILDAVCFGLYGDVPGDRSVAKRLRCDQAAPGVAPTVRLEATLSGRRFRIHRSAAWERPKKRGTGLTSEQASVVVAERLSGQWVTLSTRLDEAGHLMTRLVGMNLTQFTQVAMLPQGRFQAFLRARSEDRHRLLQQLFRTGRFEDAERWLRERRRALQEESRTHHQTVADLISRCSEAVGSPLPEVWDLHDLTDAADAGTLRWWAEGVHADAEAARRRATVAASDAEATEADTRAALDAARRRDERRTRVLEATQKHRRLVETTAGIEQARSSLDAARRATGVAPLHRVAAQAAGSWQAAQHRAEEALTRVRELGIPSAEPTGLREVLAAARTGAAEARALRPRSLRLAAAETELASAAAAVTRIGDQREAAAARAETLPTRVVRLRSEIEAARAAGSQVEVLSSRLHDVDGRLAAGDLHAALTGQLASAELARAQAQQRAVAAREHWLDVREARLDGMAAEIAGRLAVGGCCPVCGSAEHPAKAVSRPDAPDAAAEKAAQRALDDANTTAHLRDVELRDLTTRLTLAAEQAGPELREVLAERRRSLASELEQAARSADGVVALDQELQSVEAELERARAQLGDLTDRLSSRDRDPGRAARRGAGAARAAGRRADRHRSRRSFRARGVLSRARGRSRGGADRPDRTGGSRERGPGSAALARRGGRPGRVRLTRAGGRGGAARGGAAAVRAAAAGARP